MHDLYNTELYILKKPRHWRLTARSLEFMLEDRERRLIFMSLRNALPDKGSSSSYKIKGTLSLIKDSGK